MTDEQLEHLPELRAFWAAVAARANPLPAIERLPNSFSMCASGQTVNDATCANWAEYKVKFPKRPVVKMCEGCAIAARCAV